MVTVNRATARAVNALTARWARTVPGADGTVFATPGVWPLLGLLAEGADAAVRGELTEALGLPRDRAARAARGLLAALDATDGVDAAVGLWTRRELPLDEGWLAKLPAGTHGLLSGDLDADAAALDRWARERTDGLIRSLPLELAPATWLVLASALVVRTEWERPFRDERLVPGAGPWQGRKRALAGLVRHDTALDDIGLARTPDGDLTEVKVRGGNGIDVHLLLGDPSLAAGEVLGAGVGLLDGTYPVEPGSALALGTTGPGLAVTETRTLEPRPPHVELTVPRFTVTAEHDLLDAAALFGLGTATDGSDRHFPGVGSGPLRLCSARQSATASFAATGFEAAAVTALGIEWMGLPPEPEHTSTVVRAVLDRPFGFLAVHRATRLVLAAGWVVEPEPYDEDEPPDFTP
ncbi:proteinase inhibitor I4 serpin [Streptomyces sp. YC537]|uniref:Proteinase inhibitor I4 serpin n=2 Tax=Streptomyces boluensis TaxID=1775135 RepID=A0A964UVZ5_9ACTN|nr:proteinase inhibitor I4 serpin [Streptomyces boluensis]